MPSQATSYFYTLVAMGAVALMLTNAFEIQVSSLKSESERRELGRLLETVASEGTELVALTQATGATTRVCIRFPTMIGTKHYWVRLKSEGSGAWVEGGFGEPWVGEPRFRVELPGGISASGTYRGGYGTLSLTCELQGSGIVLTLGRWEVG
jgi:hypothetical protein